MVTRKYRVPVHEEAHGGWWNEAGTWYITAIDIDGTIYYDYGYTAIPKGQWSSDGKVRVDWIDEGDTFKITVDVNGTDFYFPYTYEYGHVCQFISFECFCDDGGFFDNEDDIPIAAFTATPANCSSSAVLDASGSQSYSGGLSFEWDFGDGSKISSSYVSITHDFPGSGVYPVTLTVTDNTSGNVSDPVTHQVTVKGDFVANLQARYLSQGATTYTVRVEAVTEGGQSPYSYSWNITGAQSYTGSGNYRDIVVLNGNEATVQLTVTDSSSSPQCSASGTFHTESPPLTDPGNPPDPCAQ